MESAPFRPRRSPLALLALYAAFAFVAVLITGGVAYYLNAFGSRAQIEGRMAVLGVRLLEGGFQDREAYEYTWFGRKLLPTPIPAGQELLDYARTDSAEFMLFFNQKTSETQIRQLSPVSEVLVSATTTLGWLSVVPDGSVLAYAELVSLTLPSEGPLEATAVYNPARWHLRILDTATGRVTDHGAGSAPRLFVRDGKPYVVFLVPEGVRIRALSETPVQDYTLAYPVTGLWPPEVSPDGKYLAVFDEERMSYELFQYELEAGEIRTTALPRLPGQQRIITFAGDRLVAVEWDPVLEVTPLTVSDIRTGKTLVTLFADDNLLAARRLIPLP